LYVFPLLGRVAVAGGFRFGLVSVTASTLPLCGSVYCLSTIL
jgi:hypothetical protein